MRVALNVEYISAWYYLVVTCVDTCGYTWVLDPHFPAILTKLNGVSINLINYGISHFFPNFPASFTFLLKELIWGMPPLSCKHRVNSAFINQAFYLLCIVIDLSFFLPSVIKIYLINSKDRICGTKIISLQMLHFEYVKIWKALYFWYFWNMKQKSYQYHCQLLSSIVLSFSCLNIL